MVPIRPVWILLVAGLVTLSGCIVGPPPGEPLTLEEPAVVTQTATNSYEQDVGIQFHATPANVAEGWTLTFPETVTAIDLTLTWTQTLNDFTLRIEPPEGEAEDHSATAGSTLAVQIEPAQPGTYRFVPRTQGVVLEDALTFEVTYSWLEPVVVASVTSEAQAPPLVTVRRDGDAWRAEAVYQRSAAVGNALAVDVHTFNGALDLSGSGDRAAMTVTAWARADTEERARGLLDALDVTLSLGADSARVKATRGTAQTSDGESVGASADLVLPATLKGTVKTSNGQVSLQNVRTDGLEVKTSNGEIRGDATASGDVSLGTSNGQVTFHLTPTGSMRLDVDTSNGQVELELKESAAIGYKLDADTSNGRVAEDMAEASLDKENSRSATLTTTDYDGRSIQVTGSVDSSNGHIDFNGQ